jgi:hypothetical protein
MHAHLDFDFRLHHSAGWDRPLGEAPVPDDAGGSLWGVFDETERAYASSYCTPYTLAYNPGRYRLCRSYSYPCKDRVPLIAPYDQRIDGFYAERFSMLLYHSRNGNFNRYEGSITYWIKPGFFPELTGYTRVFSSISRSRFEGTDYWHTFVHLWWLPGENGKAYPERCSFLYPWAAYSMLFAAHKRSIHFPDKGIDWCIYSTPSLNHRFHDLITPEGLDHDPYAGGHIFQAHRWTHVTLSWRNFEGEPTLSRILVNGREWQGFMISGDPWVTGVGIAPPRPPDYTSIFTENLLNPFMLGGSRWSMRSANSTMDEFIMTSGVKETTLIRRSKCTQCSGKGYVRCGFPLCLSEFNCFKLCGGKCRWKGICKLFCGWFGSKPKGSCCFNYMCRFFCGMFGKDPRWGGGDGGLCSNGTTKCKGTGKLPCPWCKGLGYIMEEKKDIEPVERLRQEWWAGRYYRQNDAQFTSSKIDLSRVPGRLVAEPNPVPDPYGEPRWKGKEGLSVGEATRWLKQTWCHPKVKILGLTWTGYTHGIQDHGALVPAHLPAQLEVSLEAKEMDGRWVQVAGPFLDQDAGWAGVFVKSPSGKIRYRVRFNTRCDPVNAILLETPVLDDLTIYWATRPQFVSWVESY